MSDRDAENQARALLAAIAPRLGEAPHAILGVAADAAPDVRRAAFLRLTKQYHPMRFARFSPDVVRQANEVFLTIKRAYDQLSAPAKVAQGTGPLSARPAASSPPPASRQSSPAIPRATTPTPAAGRSALDPPTHPPTSRPATPRAPTPTPVPTRSALDPATQPGPAPAPPPPPRHATATPATSFRAHAPSVAPATRPLSAAEQAMEPAMDLIRRKLWAEARQALLKLAVAQPQEKLFRAYMHYARGRESQDAGKLDEARAEWQRAVGLDPELTAAKRALEELPPEPSGGGLLGKLFGKK